MINWDADTKAKEKAEEKKPEITIDEIETGTVITVRNAGPAGKVFQFRDGEFLRVIPANVFVGTYNDPYIARSPTEAIRKGKKSYIFNSVFVPKEWTDDIVKQIKEHFPRIRKMVEQGRLKKRT